MAYEGKLPRAEAERGAGAALQSQEERKDAGGLEAFWAYRSKKARDELLVDYVPGPTDTSGVTLTEELRQLTELLAKNAHEHWARQRMADG